MEFFLNFTNKIWESTNKCHISKPFFCLNVQGQKDFHNAYYGLQKFYESIYLDKNGQDDIVKSILSKDFWDSYAKGTDPDPKKPDYAPSLSILLSLIALLILML